MIIVRLKFETGYELASIWRHLVVKEYIAGTQSKSAEFIEYFGKQIPGEILTFKK